MNTLIQNRYSTRAFSDTPVTPTQVETLLNAARWAPSSMNEQPWYFVYAHKGTEGYNKLLDSLMEGNSPWAQNAPLLIAAFAKKTFNRNGNVNRHALYDLGAAVAQLTLQATELELFVHQMGGFYANKLVEATQISSEYEPGVVLAIGALGDVNALPEPYLTREKAPRVRKELNQISMEL